MSKMGAIWRQLLGIAISGVSIFWGNGTLAQSKIIPDNTLGAERSNVIPNFNGLPVEVINGGAIRGQNLFHSFLEFNVSQGRGAYFYSPSAAIQNIVTRVTGNNRSEILGVLGTFGNSNPNLFLINPNGIIFGRNARLDVSGSFAATTANAIQFGNQGTFNATEPNNPALLTVDPTALFYNQIARSATIQNSSTAPAGVAPTGGNSSGLRVPDGKSLLLVGGDIEMDGGRLRAYGGHVELGGLATPGTVGLGVDGNNLSLSFPTQSTRASVSLLNEAAVTVSAGSGGSITVNASDLNLKSGSSLNAGIGQGLGSVGANAGDITLNATGDVKLDDSGITNNVQQQAIGNGGNITLSSNSLGLTGAAQLQVVTLGQGNAGNVTINATGYVKFDGHGSFIASNVQQQAIGNGGNITLSSNSFELTGGAQLQAVTLGQGNAGNVMINAAKSVSVDNSVINSTVGAINNPQNNLAIGNGGNIQITTDQLSLTHRAQLAASTFGQGNAGSVIINAAKSVSLDNSAISSNVGTVNIIPKGNSGNIDIQAGSVSVTNGAQLQTVTYGQGDAGNVSIRARDAVTFAGVNNGHSGIFSTVQSTGVGKGGNINIQASSLSVTDGAELRTNTLGKGDAGNVSINVAKSVSVDNSFIFSTVGINNPRNNLAIGNGGNIQITTDQLSLTHGAQLAASTLGQGNAGNVIINAAKSVSLDNSVIFSNVGTVDIIPKGNSGNIDIQAGSVSVTNGAQLQTVTYGQGDAGNVSIRARVSASQMLLTSGF